VFVALGEGGRGYRHASHPRNRNNGEERLTHDISLRAEIQRLLLQRSAALRHCSPFDAKIVRQTDGQDSVWRLSFWKAVGRQYQREWRAPNSIVDPITGYVNLAVERKDSQNQPNAIRC